MANGLATSIVYVQTLGLAEDLMEAALKMPEAKIEWA